MTNYQQWQLIRYGDFIPDTAQQETESGTSQAEDMAAKVDTYYELELINDEH